MVGRGGLVAVSSRHVSFSCTAETRGLADAIGQDYKRVLRFQLFPSLIKMQCSMLGSWGAAIAKTTGSLYQLRSLDFGLDQPLNTHPLVVFYHPANATMGHDFMSLTWSGFLGSVTAYSHFIGVSEKVWDAYHEASSRFGYPDQFLLRDIAQVRGARMPSPPRRRAAHSRAV